jgi:organic hydroperoxide reductase OsmC/OhrA
MQDFPHFYRVLADGTIDGDVALSAEHLSTLRSASPAQFGGPGDRWSPETFLVGALGDCFILTFRAVARASQLPWTTLQCEVTGTLDRIDRATQFTKFEIRAHLEVPAGTGVEQARRALEKAEHNCLISNSLKGAIQLIPEVHVAVEPVGEVVLA